MQHPPSRISSVLVVEDDCGIAELLKCALGDAYTVECVGDVPGALERLTAQPPDVIVLDCLLPGGPCGDVLEVAKWRQCAVVPMSGSPEVLMELEASGYRCLQKPFRIAALLEAIEAARSRQGVPQ